MAKFLLIIIFCIFKVIIPFESIYITNFNTTTQEKYGQKYKQESGMDIDTIIGILTIIEYTPEAAEYIFQAYKNDLYKESKKYINENSLDYLNKTVEDIFSDSSHFISDLFDIIKSNTTIITYFKNILISIKNNQFEDESYIIENICNIFNIEGFDKIIAFFTSPEHNTAILRLVEREIISKTIFAKIFDILKPLIYKHVDTLMPFLFDVIKAMNNFDNVIDVAKDFIWENKNSSLMLDFRRAFEDDEFRKSFLDNFDLAKENINIIIKEVIKNKIFVLKMFDFIEEGPIIEKLAGLIKNINNNDYILDNVPEILEYVNSIDPKSVDDIFKIAVSSLERLTQQDTVDEFISLDVTFYLDKYFGKEFIKYEVSQKCQIFLHRVFFDDFKVDYNSTNQELMKNLTYMRLFFLERILLHTTKNQNDFLTFDNCFDKKYDEKRTEKTEFPYNLQPIFIIGMFDDVTNKSLFNDSVLSEKYNYFLSYCLPFGKFKENDTEVCSEADYGNIVKIFMEIPFNMNQSNVTPFIIYDNTFDSSQKVFGIISLVILLIPFIIRIFLYIYEKISFKLYEKKEMINELNSEENKDDINIRKSKLVTKLKRQKKFRLKAPKWYRYLNEYFSLIKNGSELFNFGSKETLLNNVNGITYIKGLLGISMILYIIGQTYLTLNNLPFKAFSLSEFNNSVKSPFYLILLIGLRYSPRIMLSCSGYTLIYKFLCFIEQEQNNYLLKFYLLQSYKYILLIVVFVFMRYSVYYLNALFTGKKRPMLEIFNYFSEQQQEESSFRIFFRFLVGYFGSFKFNSRQILIQYFYIPINEVFFFIVFTLFISFGYQYKWRMDIIIIIIVLILFAFKILVFFFYFYENQKYSTLFFYLYDYGAFMINPFFNMPSFLIGMFFGLINYSIQRGVNFDKDRNYQRILSMSNSDIQFSINDTDSNEGGALEKRMTVLGKNNTVKGLELDIISENNEYYKEDQNDAKRSYSVAAKKINITKAKQKKKENKDINYTENFNKNVNRTISVVNTRDERLKEMPFLLWPTKFLNFHSQNEGRCYFKIIIFFSIIFLIFFSVVQFYFVGKYCKINERVDSNKDILDKLSLQNVISNLTLNFFYVIDVDLVVFMINWAFFILYSKGYKTADIYDFFNNSFWSFFLKCYFSFIVIACSIILSIFYTSESMIKFTLVNVILFSFINMVLILFGVILFYSLYEMPLKKIFKSFLIKDLILDEDSDDDNDDYYENDEKSTLTY